MNPQIEFDHGDWIGIVGALRFKMAKVREQNWNTATMEYDFKLYEDLYNKCSMMLDITEPSPIKKARMSITFTL